MDHRRGDQAAADRIAAPGIPQSVVRQLIGGRRTDLHHVAVEAFLEVQRGPAQRRTVLVGDRMMLPEQHRSDRTLVAAESAREVLTARYPDGH